MEFKSYSKILMSVVVILLAFEYSSAKCYEGNVGMKKEWMRSSKIEKDVLLQSGVKFLVGRKMLQVVDDKTSYISGKNKPGNVQNSLDPQANPTSSSDKNVFAKNEHRFTKKNDESKAFLEAADEVANLMRKDYRGAARRKPPINNHQPKN